ncbi:type I restriction endonuclease subunit R [Vibrio parahaemolyticus]|uniref:type I restriction endonuclease subunit R n=1 Tax=Vibrio parahaemolyticus TaxID=670 RepID=UPI0009F0B2A6|nr:type I restriction endonuclease subunit R [Vibrio parahaemolyticus]EJG0622173.1 type I restriction endonuclease subunit R [Vibrio parahaemolyticus]EJG0640467.1 type I restriction endonuclease subunit R [Vibrio parahaemolyticus]EJG0687377.1 type I restriction endonuclease subunit R [Vibrio parahaemolyticus]EJG0701833.1 type I restriction endonuclease subunit R [Vibrio parahaemolyticus]EJG0730414.1 type I restriction endonuclease subunit R [Vibrio parahaemolyticus]
MSTQSEAQLEKELIDQLVSADFKPVDIGNAEALKANLKTQLQKANGITLTEREFESVLIKLEKGNIFDKSKRLKGKVDVTREDGTTDYLTLLFDDASKNRFQVTNQITIQGTYENRYDVTILVNGLPLIQIELKRRGIELAEAFNQIKRYDKHTYGAQGGLFNYVQLFVISNGVNTKYFSNNRELSFKQTFHWTDVENNKINSLPQFADAFLNQPHLTKMLSRYIVQNESGKFLMVLRPYQFYAVEAIVNQVKTNDKHGYIWHTTGSGKTLTSFKTAQILSTLEEVDRVVFVVDRKDLDYQTAKEFDAFLRGSVDSTGDTKSLLNQFLGSRPVPKKVATTAGNSANDGEALSQVAEYAPIYSNKVNRINKLTITTIQKLNNLITKPRFKAQVEHLRQERVVFIFDECHRSQFGETHQNIVDFFEKAQLFGFTGTPIFAKNATAKKVEGKGTQKRTTKDLFGERLHSYVIVDAIKDDNVLPFAIEYYGKLKHKNNGMDVDVSSIDVAEFFSSPERIKQVCEHIIGIHGHKTKRKFNAMLCVASVPDLITYYDTFKALKEEGRHKLNIGTIFSYGVNEEEEFEGEVNVKGLAEANAKVHSRDKLDAYIEDYNQQFGTSYSTKDTDSFYNYYKDLSNRTKNGEVDILLVVNMFLTGFDAPGLNTIYVDKNLKYHGLVQAFSRTNRLNGTVKSHGNVMCYRNLKPQADEAFTLFSNKQPIEFIEVPDLNGLTEDFSKALEALKSIAPDVQSVDDLPDEDMQAGFIKQFRILMRLKNQLETFSDFDIETLGISEQEFVDYASKYSDLARDLKKGPAGKESILADIDFELELLQRDEVNVGYIRHLLMTMFEESCEEAKDKKRQVIANLLATEPTLYSKRSLIEGFIEKSMQGLVQGAEFDEYIEEQKQKELSQIVEEEKLDTDKFSEMVTNIENGMSVDSLKSDDIAQLTTEKMTFRTRRTILPRIAERLKGFAATFIEGFH